MTARSGVFGDNVASLRVSEKLGYVPDGTEVHTPRGVAATMTRLLLARSDWEDQSPRWPAVEIEGLDACLPHVRTADGGVIAPGEPLRQPWAEAIRALGPQCRYLFATAAPDRGQTAG